MVILHNEYHRKLIDTGEVHPFIKVTLGRAAVTGVRHGYIGGAAFFESHGNSGSLNDLGADNNLRQEYIHTLRDPSALLVSAGI
ncbi:hypothetical protein D3C75_1003470 [compost metagenome]